MAEPSLGLNGITLFRALKERMKWVDQRQTLLAQNVANADTPKYRPKDLKDLDFEGLLREQARNVHVKQTNPHHLKGTSAQGTYRPDTERRTYETSPDGNAVVLEEQLMKLSENGFSHKVSTELYRKQLKMISMALGKK